MNDTFLQTLRDWQSFYALLGGASATLTGLMFVAASLGAHLLNDDDDPKVRTFVTPTVIYFSLVLLLSALMNVPSQTQVALAVQFAAVGLIGVGYSLSHLPPLRGFHQDDGLEIRDWVWNLVLPLFGSLWLLGAAYSLRNSASWGMDAAAFGTMLLVMVGIHNAWSVTLYLTRRTPS
jgi:hypothetical protein